MKKRVLLISLLFALTISLVLVSAAVNSTNTTNSVSSSSDSESSVEKAYACLESSIKNGSITLQNAIFASLALGSKSNIDQKISDEKKTNSNCWPKASCTLKETALVALVYDREGKNTDAIEEWLLSKNATMNDLKWYLEIDATNHQNASCTVKYDSSSRNIGIQSDMKLIGDSTGCYSISPSGYWLEINQNCYSKKFEISCNQDFVTTLLYTKSGGDTIFVSSDTQSQSNGGTTTEEIKAKCFKTGSVCDYEGSLWTALALFKTGNDVSAYMPYLIALSEDNTRLFPSTFIYLVNGGTKEYTDVVQSQKQSKYWEISGSPGGRFYDTSLAMLALSGNGANELENAKNYLISIQDKNSGCWNNKNVRDTAFILYSAWPKAVSGATDSGGSNIVSCTSAGKSCAKAFECTSAGGSILYDYQCLGAGEFCCSVSAQTQTCQEKQGSICNSNQVCDGRSTAASDGTCCLDNCQNKPAQETCTAGDGICRDSCDANEEEIDATCSTSGSICCKAAAVQEKKSSVWFWIFLLVILIILVAAAIVYRDRIKIEILKFKGRAQTSPVRRTPPSPPGSPIGQRPMSNPAMFGRPGIPVGRPMPHPPMRPQTMTTPKPQPRTADKEMEETLRKLKEMSK
jgi:hypothetical protein